MELLGQTQTLPIQNACIAKQIIAKNLIVPTFYYGNGEKCTHFICIIYPGKHNGILLLTYEPHIEQLEQIKQLQ